MKRFLILSNCQGIGIWKVLETVPAFTEEYTHIFYANYIGLADQERQDILEDVKNADVILYQPVDSDKGSYRTSKLLTHVKEGCILLGFPYTRCNWLWPFFLEKCVETGIDYTLYEYHILQSLQTSKSKKEIVDLYRTHEIDFHLKDRMDTSIALLEEKEKHLEVQTSTYLLENYQKKRLFFTFNHPTKYLLIHCANQVLAHLGKDIQIPETITLKPYNDYKYWPIPRCVKEELGLVFEEKHPNVGYYEELLEKMLPYNQQSFNQYDPIVQTYFCHENREMYVIEDEEGHV